MDIMPHNLFHRCGHPCVLSDSRECLVIRRRYAILLCPQQGTRISYKDFYKPTIPAATIPTKVASHSTKNSAGIATDRRGDLRNQRQEEERHDAHKEKSYKEASRFARLVEASCEAQNYNEGVIILERMVSAGHVPNRDICSKLLNGLFSSFFPSPSAIFCAQKIIRRLEKHGWQDSVPYDSSGISTMSRWADIAGAFSKITDRGGSESDAGLDSRGEEYDNFMNLIRMSWSSQNYDQTFIHVKNMVSAGYVPCMLICTKLISRFASSTHSLTDAICKAQEVMKILEKHGSQDIVAYNSLLTVVCRKTRRSSVEHVIGLCIAILEQMQAYDCSPTLVTCNILMCTLCNMGRIDLAMELLDQMLQEPQFQPSCITYTILIEASFRGTHDHSKNGEGNAGGISGVIKLLEEMVAKGLQFDHDTYNCILRDMIFHGHAGQAWQLMRTLNGSHQPSGTSSSSNGFKAILAPGLISYNILLEALLCRKKWKYAEMLVLEMVFPMQCGTNDTCHDILIKSLCKRKWVHKAIMVVDDMMAKGLRPDTNSYNSIVMACCHQGCTKLAVTFMERLFSHGYVPDNAIYNTVLSSFCESGVAYPSDVVLDRLEKMGCRPSTTSSYNAYIGGLWYSGYRTKAMNMLSQMVDKGIHPDVVTYDTLIFCLCRDGRVHHAFQLMADMENTWGYKPTLTTYNNIILGLCKACHFDAAVDILKEMTERGCTPEESTYIVLVEGLARAGHVEEATKLGTDLLSCNAISSGRIRILQKTYSLQITTL